VDASSFLLVTWPGGGNVPPMVALGARLRARGHAVRAFGPPPLRARFEAEGIAYRAHRTLSQWAAAAGGGEAARHAHLHGLADDLLAELERETPGTVVVDYMLTAALCAAERARVPLVAFVHTLYAAQAVSAQSPMGMLGDIARVNELRAALGLSALARLPDLLDHADRVLVLTTPELEQSDAPCPSNVRFVGPIVEDAGPEAGWTPPGPRDGAPLVLVSLGTTPMNEAGLLARVLDALADLPVRAFVTVGDHLDPAALNAPGNAVVSRYVRHAAVLPHAALFVTHAGLGGVSAALSYGVPMLCLPLGRDQPANAAAVAALGAGRTLAPDASVEALRAATMAILGDASHGVAAARMAAALRAGGSGSAALAALEQLAGSSGRHPPP
jgi:MGT family glycosyltransferase